MAYQTNASDGNPKRRGCGTILIILPIAIVLFCAIQYFFDKSHYEKGSEAYLNSDCNIAVKHFRSVFNAIRIVDIGKFVQPSQQRLIECIAFQKAIDAQASGDSSSAILAYYSFLNEHPDSNLINESKARIYSIFNQTDSSSLVRDDVCSLVDNLQQENLIPLENDILQKFLLQCGQVFEIGQEYSQATQIYDLFLKTFPHHKLADEAKRGLIRVIIADAKASGAGIIPEPERSGASSSGNTSIVVIQNDSPEQLRIVFSGPDSFIEELEACSSCYTYSIIGPMYCPEQGPIGRYTLTPGQYDVVVQAISDSGVTPWSGSWSLAAGDEYSNCFFITSHTIP